MASTTFVDRSTGIVADWLNEVNGHVFADTPPSGTTVHAADKIEFTPAEGLTATEVQAAIEELATTKADLSYVDTQLDLKADLTYVDAELATKANVGEVGRYRNIYRGGSAALVGPIDAETPLDDTIPQASEMDGITFAAYISDQTGSKTCIEFSGMAVAKTASTTLVLALFKDGVASAVFATACDLIVDKPTNVSFKVIVDNLDNAQYNLMGGVTPGSGAAVYFNGTSAPARLFGGVSRLDLILSEVVLSV